MFLAAATGHEVSVRPEMCTREARESPLTTLELVFVCIMGGFFSIVLFCTCYKGYLQRRRAGDSKRTRRSMMEEIVGAFSVTGA